MKRGTKRGRQGELELDFDFRFGVIEAAASQQECLELIMKSFADGLTTYYCPVCKKYESYELQQQFAMLHYLKLGFTSGLRHLGRYWYAKNSLGFLVNPPKETDKNPL